VANGIGTEFCNDMKPGYPTYWVSPPLSPDTNDMDSPPVGVALVVVVIVVDCVAVDCCVVVTVVQSQGVCVGQSVGVVIVECCVEHSQGVVGHSVVCVVVVEQSHGAHVGQLSGVVVGARVGQAVVVPGVVVVVVEPDGTG